MAKNLRSIVLIGYRGAGKSVVGRILAARLGWPFVDTDERIETQAGRSIADIFASDGEAAFRDIESDVIRTLSADEPSVISAGGGAVLRDENVATLRALGSIVWLAAPPETLWSRIRGDAATAATRPNLTPDGGLDEVRRLLAEREPCYRAAADHIVDTQDAAPEAIADQIAHLIRGGSSRKM